MNHEKSKNLPKLDTSLETLDIDLETRNINPDTKDMNLETRDKDLETRDTNFEIVETATEKDSRDSTITAYSRLALRLEREIANDSRGSSLLVMAAEYDRVAVEAVTELAWHLAEDLGHKVLLVDGSFNDLGLTKALGGIASPGLMHLLAADELTEDLIQSMIRSTPHARISYVPVGFSDHSRMAPARARVLSNFLSIASGMADFILIQGPAVAKASRALAFGSLVDAVLLVTLEGESSLAKLGEAQQILSESGAERVGLLIGVSRSRSDQQ